MPLELHWLPERNDWDDLLLAAKSKPLSEALETYRSLANSRIDFAKTARLDKAVQKHLAGGHPSQQFQKFKIALLGSSTLSHLAPGIRVAGLRRGLLLDIYEAPYGMYRQEVVDRQSGLYAFDPKVVLFALDAHHTAGADHGSGERAAEALRDLWTITKQSVACDVIQQTILPIFEPLLGNNEQRCPQSPLAMVHAANENLRKFADAEGVQLLSLDWFAGRDGIANWYEPALWHRSKQEVHPRVSHLYGEQVGRLLGAIAGKSSKCLVLDLDNTLWGGVIGDDGLEGIVLGQGNAVGEAYCDFQRYARALTERGIILAVCSKNDEANAIEAFAKHPEMVLRQKDIACFVANWQDKAANLRAIAETLNIGLDSLVFADDNPAERGIIRRELPMVAVPELSDDPAEYAATIANGGYFEGFNVTDEDRERSSQYIANVERGKLRESVTDMAGYLASLKMELIWKPFDDVGLSRIVQLINKSNQFNLTTRRVVEADVRAMLDNPDYVTLQLRLKDCYGDNGVIAILIGHRSGAHLSMHTWLMSCRVLGRQVEEATLNVLTDRARHAGITKIFGEYRPTAKNGMVRDHYMRLGFEPAGANEDGSSTWVLAIDRFRPLDTKIQIIGGIDGRVRDLQEA